MEEAKQPQSPQVPIFYDPVSQDLFERKIAIPYTTVEPTVVPKADGTRYIYFDGTSYVLYIYANGGWRTQTMGGSFTGGRMNMSSPQTITDQVATLIAFTTNSMSAVGITADTANNRFTILTAGKYLVHAQLWYNQPDDQGLYQTYIYNNGGEQSRTSLTAAGTNPVSPSAVDILDLAVGDDIQVYTFHNSASDKTISNGGNLSFFSIHKI